MEKAEKLLEVNNNPDLKDELSLAYNTAVSNFKIFKALVK